MNLRLCRDCRWRRSGLTTGFLGDRCASHIVSPVHVDLVTGSTKQKLTSCEIGRLSGQPCGVEGKLWEQRG